MTAILDPVYVYSAAGKTIKKLYTSVTEDLLAVSVFTVLSSFSPEIGEMLVTAYFFAANDRLKVEITFLELFLVDLKYSYEEACISRYLLTCLFRLYSTKTENRRHFLLLDVRSRSRRTCTPYTSLFHHGNGE